MNQPEQHKEVVTMPVDNGAPFIPFSGTVAIRYENGVFGIVLAQIRPTHVDASQVVSVPHIVCQIQGSVAALTDLQTAIGNALLLAKAPEGHTQ